MGWLLLGWLLHGWLLFRWLLLVISLNKTPLGETGFLSSPYFLLTGCSGIQFFDSPPFPTQPVRPPLITYPSLCSTYVTYRTLCHAIGHQVLATLPYLGKRRISRGVTSILSLCLHPLYVVGSIYVLRPLHGTLISPSLVLNQHFKSLMC